MLKDFLKLSLVTKNVKSRSKKKCFSEVELHKKRPNFACDNYIFPITRRNKNNQWTRSSRVKRAHSNLKLHFYNKEKQEQSVDPFLTR